MKDIQNFIGIDYGSKLAGTTVIAYFQDGQVKLKRSRKKEDADQMIMNFVTEQNPDLIGIDAPLSLPGVYKDNSSFSDYFYRQCDKELKAMSPMFLGGLTARAMKLKSMLIERRIEIIEVYPAKTADYMGFKEFGYKSKRPDYQRMMKVLKGSGVMLNESTTVESSHDLDAVLALQTVLEFKKNTFRSQGDPFEGLIYY